MDASRFGRWELVGPWAREPVGPCCPVGAWPLPDLVAGSSWARGPVGPWARVAQSVHGRFQIWSPRARGPVGPWARGPA